MHESHLSISSASTKLSKSTTYKDAGVDIAAGEELIDRIKPLVRKTFTAGVLTDIGAFGAFFRPEFSQYDDPVLVSSVDGVGTKLKVAFAANKHNTVGQDLVNHCVNDIAVCGARPLFFLDYFSTGKLDVSVAEEVIAGFAKACTENGCALIGGETAEMPDIYSEGEYDLAGTIVGIVDKSSIIDGSTVTAGDVLVGLPSTGLHTNGYSLARKVLLGRYGIADAPAQLGTATIGDALLAVHRSYLGAIGVVSQNPALTGLVHVTGGGIPGNAARVVPGGLVIDVDYQSWTRPAIFDLIQETGAVSENEMRAAFNLGIGLVIIVKHAGVSTVLSQLENAGESPIIIGRVVPG